jgi:hypothetical protein
MAYLLTRAGVSSELQRCGAPVDLSMALGNQSLGGTRIHALHDGAPEAIRNQLAYQSCIAARMHTIPGLAPSSKVLLRDSMEPFSLADCPVAARCTQPVMATGLHTVWSTPLTTRPDC